MTVNGKSIVDRMVISTVQYQQQEITAFNALQILVKKLEQLESDLNELDESPDGFDGKIGVQWLYARDCLQIAEQFLYYGEHQTEAGEADRNALQQVAAAVQHLATIIQYK